MITKCSKNLDFDTLLKFENQNLQASWHNFQNEALLIEQLSFLYQNVNSNLDTYPRKQIPVLSMFWSCFIDFLISIRLILETHIPESYAIVSRSTEGVGYARKMSLNPELIPVWINKSELTNKEFRKKFGEPFPRNDSLLHPEIFSIYNLTSNFGRHQNMESTIFFSDFEQLKINKVNFNYSYIEDQTNLQRCINYVIYAYFKILSLFKEIFSNYLSKEWVDEFSKFKEHFDQHKEKLKLIFIDDPRLNEQI